MLHYGFETPTPEVQKAWMNWFAAIGDNFIDSGNPLGNGMIVTKTETKALSAEMDPATGYSILRAENMEEALNLLKDCPIIDSVRLYEAKSM